MQFQKPELKWDAGGRVGNLQQKLADLWKIEPRSEHETPPFE